MPPPVRVRPIPQASPGPKSPTPQLVREAYGSCTARPQTRPPWAIPPARNNGAVPPRHGPPSVDTLFPTLATEARNTQFQIWDQRHLDPIIRRPATNRTSCGFMAGPISPRWMLSLFVDQVPLQRLTCALRPARLRVGNSRRGGIALLENEDRIARLTPRRASQSKSMSACSSDSRDETSNPMEDRIARRVSSLVTCRRCRQCRGSQQ